MYTILCGLKKTDLRLQYNKWKWYQKKKKKKKFA